MDEWMDGQMNGDVWMNSWMDRQIDEWMDGLIGGWMDRSVEGWVGG